MHTQLVDKCIALYGTEANDSLRSVFVAGLTGEDHTLGTVVVVMDFAHDVDLCLNIYSDTDPDQRFLSSENVWFGANVLMDCQMLRWVHLGVRALKNRH